MDCSKGFDDVSQQNKRVIEDDSEGNRNTYLPTWVTGGRVERETGDISLLTMEQAKTELLVKLKSLGHELIHITEQDEEKYVLLGQLLIGLNENNVDLFERVVAFVDNQLIYDAFEKTAEIEKSGGVFIEDVGEVHGGARRTAGGVFLMLLKKIISPEVKTRVWFKQRQQQKRFKRASPKKKSSVETYVRRGSEKDNISSRSKNNIKIRDENGVVKRAKRLPKAPKKPVASLPKPVASSRPISSEEDGEIKEETIVATGQDPSSKSPSRQTGHTMTEKGSSRRGKNQRSRRKGKNQREGVKGKGKGRKVGVKD